MIIQISRNVKSISQMINEYERQLNIVGFICPCCNTTNFIYYGSYNRNVLYLEDNHIVHKILGIKRVLCKNCHKTHAVIPSFLIPYKQHSLNTVLVLLESDENSGETKVALEDRYEVSRQLILIWKKQFQDYVNKVCTMCINFDIKDVLKSLLKEIDLIKKYYDTYRQLFMMRRVKNFYNCIPT